MDAPRIRYAKTSDGVSIAYATFGRGTALVWAPDIPYTHVQLEWKQPIFQMMLGGLRPNRTLVRFDARGSGLSDRNIEVFSLDAFVMDLEAVVDHLGLESFALTGHGGSGQVAIAYAVRHPERVSHLVLVNAFARAADLVLTPQYQAMVGVLVSDWEMFTDNVGAVAFGWGHEEARRYGEFIRRCVTQEALVRLIHVLPGVDVSDLLPSVTAPTLVVRHTGLKIVSESAARLLASRIPQAWLTMVEGAYLDNVQDFVGAIDEFLGGRGAYVPTEAAVSVHTILFTDIEGSTALTQRLGDRKARELLREHERIVRECLRVHGGSEVKTMGDGFMASFVSATKALECAIAIQRAFADWNAGVEAAGRSPLQVRIGLNAGEPIAEEQDLHGTAVIMAARIADQAEGGEILAANVVRELVAGKDFLFSERGETVLRGFDEPVRLFDVCWREPDA